MREYNRDEREYSQINYNQERLLNITFRVNDVCNLKCDYCHWHSYINYELTDIKTSIDNLYKYLMYRDIKRYTLYFHGGEPSYHPKIIEILKYFRDKDKEYEIVAEIEVQTNFSLSKNHYIKILKLVDYLSISLHYKELLKTNTFDIFNSNLQLLTNKNLLNFDIMLENVDDLPAFYKYIKETILPVARLAKQSEMIYGFFEYQLAESTLISHKKFYDDYNISNSKYSYGNEKESTNELFMSETNFIGYKCDAGKNDLIINGNGDVFYCASHLTTNLNEKQGLSFSGKVDPICSLLDEKSIKKLVIISKIGVKCQWNTCCGDFYIPRTKDDI